MLPFLICVFLFFSLSFFSPFLFSLFRCGYDSLFFFALSTEYHHSLRGGKNANFFLSHKNGFARKKVFPPHSLFVTLSFLQQPFFHSISFWGLQLCRILVRGCVLVLLQPLERGRERERKGEKKEKKIHGPLGPELQNILPSWNHQL